MKEIFRKVVSYFKNPEFRFYTNSVRGLYNYMTDEAYIKKEFKINMGYELDLENPVTLNEKIQWLKLNDRKEIYTRMVDKYEVKKLIAEKIGEEYIIPTLGIWNTYEEIDFEQLPNSFVLKCTHDSGGIIICKDKATFNYKTAKKIINTHLKRNYYFTGREWPYKDVEPRIIAEPFLVDESGWDLKDYKIFCFNGNPEYVEVDFNRSIKHKLNPYTLDWEPIHFCDKSENDWDADIKKPEKLEEMIKLAKILSKDSTLLRVDMYYINGKIYVGELTFSPGSGYIAFNPMKYDKILGEKLKLPMD